uniref:Carboxylesterase type B domain-containing protein n=1 Tax=Callorhinchus milii TaxID=7868 RepID=A0A4W3JYK0_CALMI
MLNTCFSGSLVQSLNIWKIHKPLSLQVSAWLISICFQIVAVEFSYRLGLFGFLSTLDEHAPGNVGFLDMTKGLQWIKENIQYFGGDPNNVTFFGHGAGGLAVNYLLLSPLTKGLLHRAISSSGNALVPESATEQGIMYSDPLSTGKELAKRLGCPTDNNKNIVNCLQAKPMETLLNATMPKPKYGLTFLPVIDGAFLPESPREMLLKGKYMKVPYIIGLTSDEAGANLGDLLSNAYGIDTESYHNLILDYVSNHFRCVYCF